MRRLVCVVLSISFGGVAFASGPWTGIVSPARAIDWSTAGVIGGIPTITTKCGATLASSSTHTIINAAINSCASGGGGYVLLGPGTFNLGGPPVLKTNVELRGSGMSTILNVTQDAGSTWYWGGGTGALIISGANASPADAAPGIGSLSSTTVKTWTGTNGAAGVFTQGATVINLGSTPTGLSVGAVLVCFQDNAPPASVPHAGFFFSEKTGTNAISWTGEYADFGAAQEQRSVVTAINGNAVTIADPIALPTGAWSTANNARCGWLPAAQTIRNAGVANLRIRTTNWNEGHQCVICIAWAHNVWV